MCRRRIEGRAWRSATTSARSANRSGRHRRNTRSSANSRTAHEGSLAEIAAAVYPCGRGYLDVAEHAAARADGEHRYTPFVEKDTGAEFREAVARMGEFVDDCAERFPGERDAMREAFVRSARLEHAFWEMAYERETWAVDPAAGDADDRR